MELLQTPTKRKFSGSSVVSIFYMGHLVYCYDLNNGWTWSLTIFTYLLFTYLHQHICEEYHPNYFPLSLKDFKKCKSQSNSICNFVSNCISILHSSCNHEQINISTNRKCKQFNVLTLVNVSIEVV